MSEPEKGSLYLVFRLKPDSDSIASIPLYSNVSKKFAEKWAENEISISVDDTYLGLMEVEFLSSGIVSRVSLVKKFSSHTKSDNVFGDAKDNNINLLF